MAFADMWFEIAGELNVPAPFAQTKLNEALGQIYDDEEQQMWSFQIREADNWLAPGLVFATGWPTKRHHAHSDGFIHAEPYSNEIRGNHRAAERWRRHRGRPFLTELQIRSPFFSLYNIIHFDGHDTLTLDRPWMEPVDLPRRFFVEHWPGWDWDDDKEWDEAWDHDHDHDHRREHWQPYMVYQAYFPAPVKDFKRFFEIRDTMNSGIVDYWTYSQRDLSRLDPQRVIFDLPTHAAFRGLDERGHGTEFESATLGHPMYELWPHPLSVQPFTFSSLRRGPMLEHPHDTVPAPLTEDMLKWRCREALYLFKEAQKGETVQRGSGANWQFLAEAAAAEYKAARNRIGKRDVALVDLFFNRFRPNLAERGAPFATIDGRLNIGGW